jgi:ArsR family transcriptional regulator
MRNLNNQQKIFKALSDSNRLRILRMLKEKNLCVCEITSILDLAVSTVSQHLKILKNADFILEQKDGKWVNYLINPHPNDPRISTILTSLDFWIADESVIISDKKKILSIDRHKICNK